MDSTRNEENNEEKNEEKNDVLFDFANPSAFTYWNVVNDGVMGGVSQSRLVNTTQNTALFAGNVSLENNGGFASVEARFEPVDLSTYDGIEITYRGDGKRYGFNMRDSRKRTVHQADFIAKEASDWQNVRIPFNRLTPLVYGFKVASDPFNPKNIITMQLIISDKQVGSFAIELKSIGAYREVK